MRITINLITQTLELNDGDKLVKAYSVSTAKNGPGQEWKSYKTPLGRHEIAEKIGERADIGTVFKERMPTGEVLQVNADIDYDPVVTRILTLRGLEEGFNAGENVDTYKRRIYIHGTVHEHLIGQPFSNGCIRMKNSDIIELFDFVQEGTEVHIYIRSPLARG